MKAFVSTIDIRPHSYDGVVLTGLRYTAVFAYVAWPIALAGGIGTGLAGLALKAVIRAYKLG